RRNLRNVRHRVLRRGGGRRRVRNGVRGRGGSGFGLKSCHGGGGVVLARGLDIRDRAHWRRGLGNGGGGDCGVGRRRGERGGGRRCADGGGRRCGNGRRRGDRRGADLGGSRPTDRRRGRSDGRRGHGRRDHRLSNDRTRRPGIGQGRGIRRRR